jgi:hypothetical protein
MRKKVFLGTNSYPVEAQQTIQGIYATHVSVVYGHNLGTGDVFATIFFLAPPLNLL